MCLLFSVEGILEYFFIFSFIYEMHENYSYIGSTIIVLMHREVSLIRSSKITNRTLMRKISKRNRGHEIQ